MKTIIGNITFMIKLRMHLIAEYFRYLYHVNKPINKNRVKCFLVSIFLGFIFCRKVKLEIYVEMYDLINNTKGSN